MESIETKDKGTEGGSKCVISWTAALGWLGMVNGLCGAFGAVVFGTDGESVMDQEFETIIAHLHVSIFYIR